MMEMLPAFIIGSIIFSIGTIMLTGRLSDLIAGYHTQEVKNKFNPKKLSRFIGLLLCVCSLLLILMAYGFTTGSNSLAVFAIITIIILTVLSIIIINTIEYFRN